MKVVGWRRLAVRSMISLPLCRSPWEGFLVENTSSDSFELYYGMFMYHQNALEQLERLDMVFESINKGGCITFTGSNCLVRRCNR